MFELRRHCGYIQIVVCGTPQATAEIGLKQPGKSRWLQLAKRVWQDLARAAISDPVVFLEFPVAFPGDQSTTMRFDPRLYSNGPTSPTSAEHSRRLGRPEIISWRIYRNVHKLSIPTNPWLLSKSRRHSMNEFYQWSLLWFGGNLFFQTLDHPRS